MGDHQEQLAELTRAINALNERLERSERRVERTRRVYRGAFAATALAALLGWSGVFEPVSAAFAEVSGAPAPAAAPAQAATPQQGEMTKEEIQQAMMAMMKTAVAKSMQLAQKSPEALSGADAVALVDTAQLLAFYSVIGNTDEVEGMLQEMNSALRAVPYMAAEMQRMNMTMSSMNYSIGQSMGKMGSWNPMPWGP